MRMRFSAYCLEYGSRSGPPSTLGFTALASVLALILCGCSGAPGGDSTIQGVSELKVGGVAKLVSFDDSDILLDEVGVTSPGKPAQPTTRATKAVKLRLPVGTKVLVQEIVGDDARVLVQGGSSDGAICWVETIRLAPSPQ